MQERSPSFAGSKAPLDVVPVIYRFPIRKKMPAHKVGSLWKFLASEVDAWFKGGKAAQVTPPK